MPYVSLYRKYRSQTFDDVIGQEHVIRTVRNAIKAGRIGQGYLFCGSRGTGKTTVARLIAKAMNCLSSDGPTPDPCNVCEACLAITDGAAVDVIEMDAASNRGVDDVDALRDGVKYPPMRFRYKVYIIDEAHQLSAQAKDAFLKTLEEPPPHAVFILATTESHKIPITIRSRCQQFDFRRGTVGEINGRLKYVCDGEQAVIEDDALELVARSANGSYRDSLSLLEQVIAYTEGSITVKDVYTVLGTVDEDVLLELGSVLHDGDSAAAFGIADRLLREGKDVRELLKSAANHFRDILAIKVGADTFRRDDPRWKSQAEALTQSHLLHIIDVFAAAEKDLRWNEQHRLALEMALLKAMKKPAPAGSRTVERVEEYSVPERKAQRPSPPTAQKITKPAADAQPLEPAESATDIINEPAARVEAEAAREADVVQAQGPVADGSLTGDGPSLSLLQRDWKRILMHVSKVYKKVSVAAVAGEGMPVKLDDDEVTIGFDAKHAFHMSQTQQNANFIVDAMEAVYSRKFRVVTMVVDAAPGGKTTVSETAGTAKTVSNEHPRKDEALLVFNGKEVEPGEDPWGEEL